MGRKTIFSFVIFCCVPALLSGCFGFLTTYPTECDVDLPIIGNHNPTSDYWAAVSGSDAQRYQDIFYLSNKNEFIDKWGQPDEIVKISENKEVLVYNISSWCGIVPAFFVTVPLMLPVCDGFDRVTFEDNKAVHINFRKQSAVGVLLPIGVFAPNHCPLEGPPSNKSKERTE